MYLVTITQNIYRTIQKQLIADVVVVQQIKLRNTFKMFSLKQLTFKKKKKKLSPTFYDSTLIHSGIMMDCHISGLFWKYWNDKANSSVFAILCRHLSLKSKDEYETKKVLPNPCFHRGLHVFIYRYPCKLRIS